MDAIFKNSDEKDQENELINKNYKSSVPEKFQWRNWAINAEGITRGRAL